MFLFFVDEVFVLAEAEKALKWSR